MQSLHLKGQILHRASMIQQSTNYANCNKSFSRASRSCTRAQTRRGYHSPPHASNPFFAGISSLLGKSRDTVKSDSVGQRPPADKSPTVDGSKPVFPPYTVLRKTKDYSIRLYNVYPVVEMEYQRREEGYASLGAYIDGGNSEGAQFVHTQPVVMTYNSDGRKLMQMFVGPRRGAPAGSEAAASSTTVVTSLPSPKEPTVRVNVSGGEVVAVMQFEGYITPSSAEAARQRLISCLRQDGVKLSAADSAGRFRCAQYGAVYQLGERLNELMLQVEV